ncbi:hypothetical protein EMIT051CA3_20012 [Pseudomonas chlororaphis]
MRLVANELSKFLPTNKELVKIYFKIAAIFLGLLVAGHPSITTSLQLDGWDVEELHSDSLKLLSSGAQ